MERSEASVTLSLLQEGGNLSHRAYKPLFTRTQDSPNLRPAIIYARGKLKYASHTVMIMMPKEMGTGK
jgi:hypothetical protein